MASKNVSKNIVTGEEQKVEASGSEGTSSSGGESKPVAEPGITKSAVKQTVIRLKRRIEDSPPKILVVSYKRTKTELSDISSNDAAEDSPTASTSAGGASESSSKILRLVGTVPVPGEKEDDKNIVEAVKNIIGSVASTSVEPKVTPRRSIKAKTSKISEKARAQVKKTSEDSRFKIISNKRGVSSNDEETEDPENDFMNLLELVPESDLPRKREKPEGFEPGNVTCNGYPMLKETTVENGFVYDLYISSDPCIDDFIISDHFLSVEEAEELDFGVLREGDEEDHSMEDEDDSNDEDNWRNDYPDSEEEGLRDDSYGAAEDDSDENAHHQFRSMRIRNNSSSDEDIVYGIEDDNDGFAHFDKKYAQYKRRVMKDYSDEVVSVSSDSDCDLG